MLPRIESDLNIIMGGLTLPCYNTESALALKTVTISLKNKKSLHNNVSAALSEY